MSSVTTGTLQQTNRTPTATLSAHPPTQPSVPISVVSAQARPYDASDNNLNYNPVLAWTSTEDRHLFSLDVTWQRL